MKKSVILKKLESYKEDIYETLDNITSLLEVDLEDDILCEMSTTFKEQVEEAVLGNPECNYNDLVEYINNNY
jgi:hypothetical protein